LIHNAARLLSENDGKNVGIADIARAAGVSRQAVYIHFPGRADLLIAALRYLDTSHGLDDELRRFREAQTATEILETYVEFWGRYVPTIFGSAKALMVFKETDNAAGEAWKEWTGTLRDGLQRTIENIEHEGLLSPDWTIDEAVDLMWTMFSIESWERLVKDSGWTPDRYIERQLKILKTVLLR
jgi:AcrR family transcriptional regulator